MVVEQTNLYNIQNTGQSVNTNHNEVEQLIGMNMKMGHCSPAIIYFILVYPIEVFCYS